MIDDSFMSNSVFGSWVVNLVKLVDIRLPLCVKQLLKVLHSGLSLWVVNNQVGRYWIATVSVQYVLLLKVLGLGFSSEVSYC